MESNSMARYADVLRRVNNPAPFLLRLKNLGARLQAGLSSHPGTQHPELPKFSTIKRR